MKKPLLVSILSVGFFSLQIQILAAPQEIRGGIKQKVGNAAKKAAAEAVVFYSGEPQFSSIEGTSIIYATNTHETILKIGDAFYFPYIYFNPVGHTRERVWLVSGSAHGPWLPATTIPEHAREIECSQINANPSDPYQLCALPWPH